MSLSVFLAYSTPLLMPQSAAAAPQSASAAPVSAPDAVDATRLSGDLSQTSATAASEAAAGPGGLRGLVQSALDSK